MADNKLALNAGWDADLLAGEIQALVDLDFDVELTGFSLAEIDFVLDEARERSTHDVGPEDELRTPPHHPLSRAGDVWHLGRHRLVCGDARGPNALTALLVGEQADLIFTDPPYNVAIDGNVCGLGRVKHREFAFAAGEMSSGEFTAFSPADTRGCREGLSGWCHRFRLHGLAAYG